MTREPNKPLYINFLWHMHQPYYKDSFTGEYILPWVRLHGFKDYYDMVAILEEFPQIHQTFNLVPSLIIQLDDYMDDRASEFWLKLTMKPAAQLDLEDKKEILHNFFGANWNNMIKPHRRYAELLRRRGEHISPSELGKIQERFSTQDFLDLQVWYNLAWFDPLIVERDRFLKELADKGRNFTEEEKSLLLQKGKEVLKMIIPEYKEMQDEGQIEVSISPYYHPILPLLYDSDIAKVAVPSMNLPPRFHHPEDAKWQIDRAVELYQDRFGRNPRGMWPSEGSVSEDIIPLITEVGLEWIASDEEIVAKSLNTQLERDTRGNVVDPTLLYHPYAVEKEGKMLSIVFRDHALSDLIGFVYNRWDPEKAANDLVNRLLYAQKRASVTPGDHLVSIILDGDNAWEYYKNDGLDFFRALYAKLSKEPLLKTVTVSEYLQSHPTRCILPKLFPGSWINHNFKIWIGHREDNTAWAYLEKAREDLTRYEALPKDGDSEKIATAWREIYIAEGSDWFWWYGDENFSLEADKFDEMFRNHLMNIYRLLGENIPSELFIPIKTVGKSVCEPIQLISPLIDGKLSYYYEWTGAGIYDASTAGGSMHRAENIIESIYYGFDLENLYIRVDGDFTTSDNEVNDELELILDIIEPRGERIQMEIATGEEKEKATIYWERSSSSDSSDMIACGALNKIIELKLPFSALGFNPNDEVRLFLEIRREGSLLERWPNQMPISFDVPDENFEAVMWSA